MLRPHGGGKGRGRGLLTPSSRASGPGRGSLQAGAHVFVADLQPECEEQDLLNHFGKFSEVLNATIERERATGLSKCLGSIRLADSSAVARLVSIEHRLWGTLLRVATKPFDKFLASVPGDGTDEGYSAMLVCGLVDAGPEENREKVRTYFTQFGTVAEVELLADAEGSSQSPSAYVRMEVLHRVGNETWQVQLRRGAKRRKVGGDGPPLGAPDLEDVVRFYIGNLPAEAAEDDLLEAFGSLGHIEHVSLARSGSGASKGGSPSYGFVSFGAASVSQELTRQMLEETHYVRGSLVRVQKRRGSVTAIIDKGAEAKGDGGCEKGGWSCKAAYRDGDSKDGYGKGCGNNFKGGASEKGFGKGNGVGKGDHGWSAPFGKSNPVGKGNGFGKGCEKADGFGKGVCGKDKDYGKGSYGWYGKGDDFGKGAGTLDEKLPGLPGLPSTFSSFGQASGDYQPIDALAEIVAEAGTT